MDKHCSQCEQMPVFNKEADDERSYLCSNCLHGVTGKITEEEKILQRHNEMSIANILKEREINNDQR